MKSLAILYFLLLLFFLFALDYDPFFISFPMVGFEENVSGRWISANESVMSVNMNSGKSEAVGEGITQGTNRVKPFPFPPPFL